MVSNLLKRVARKLGVQKPLNSRLCGALGGGAVSSPTGGLLSRYGAVWWLILALSVLVVLGLSLYAGVSWLGVVYRNTAYFEGVSPFIQGVREYSLPRKIVRYGSDSTAKFSEVVYVLRSFGLGYKPDDGVLIIPFIFSGIYSMFAVPVILGATFVIVVRERGILSRMTGRRLPKIFKYLYLIIWLMSFWLAGVLSFMAVF